MLVNLCKLQILYNFLLFDPQYKGLHVKSKAMYTLIIDTMMYRMNKGTIEIDKNGHQYIEFETEYFKKLLNISVNAVNKFKKELIKVVLIDVLQKQENNVFTSTCQKSKTKNFIIIIKRRNPTNTHISNYLNSYLKRHINQYLSIKNSRTTGRFVDNHGVYIQNILIIAS